MPGVSQLLGDAFVEIRPEFTKFTGELKNGLGEATAKGTAESASSLDKLEKVGRAAFLGLGAAAIGFGVAFVKAGLEGEASTARLRQVVQNAGGDFAALDESVGKSAEHMAKLGITEDETRDALARIVGITQDVTGSQRVLAIATDLAAARHIDLQSAVNLVARAAVGVTTPLKRMGIEVDTSGTKTQVATRALDALQQRFGGAAQAQADTYSGKLKAFGAEMHNTEEEIGTALLPTIGKVAEGLGATVGFFDRNRDAAIALGVVIGGPLTAAIGVFIVREIQMIATKTVDFLESTAIAALYVGDALNTASTAAYVYTSSLLAAIGPVGLAAAAIGLLTGAITIDSTNTKAATDEAKHYIESLKGSGDEAEVLKDRIATLSKQRDDQFLATERAATAEGTWQKVGGQAKALYDQQTAGIDQLKGRLKDLQSQQKASTQAHSDLVAAQTKDKQSSGDLASQLGVTSDVVEALAKKLGIDLAKRTDEQTQKIIDLNDRLKETNPHALAVADALAKLADETLDAGEKAAAFKTALDLVVGAGIPLETATAGMRDAIGKIGDKEDIAAQKTKAFKTALDLLLGGNIDAERAAITFGNTLDGMADKLKANADNLDINTKAGRENLTLIEDSVTGIRNHVEALQNQGASQADIKKAYDADTKALRDQLAAAGLSGAEIDKLLARYNLVPGALDKAIGAMQGLSTNLDLSTDAGRRNVGMIDDAVTKIRDHIEAMRQQGASADQLKTAFAGDTQSLRDQLAQAGFTKDQIDKLIASYGLVPSSINTVVTADTTPAQKAWDDLMKAAQPYLDALAKLSPEQIKGAAGGITVPHFASGGWVPGGLGQPVAAVVHGGEFVLSAAMVRGLSGLLGAPIATPVSTKPATPPGPVVGQLNVYETASAYKTGVEAAMAIRSSQYRRTGQ